MVLAKTPGVNVLFPFYEYYTQDYPLDMAELFHNPQREKFGYLWTNLSPSFIKQTIKYKNPRLFFTGFYITCYEDAGICLSLFNRYLYIVMTSKFEWFSKNFSENGAFYERLLDSGKDIDSMRWIGFYEFLKACYNHFYVPFKKFLASKRPDRCWVSFSINDLSPQNLMYSDFLCGVPSLEVFRGGTLEDFSPTFWEKAVEEGPLGNPEIPILQAFFDYFPGTSKYAPETIIEKVEIGQYRELKDFGLI